MPFDEDFGTEFQPAENLAHRAVVYTNRTGIVSNATVWREAGLADAWIGRSQATADARTVEPTCEGLA